MPFVFYDLNYLLFLAPALLLAFIAQMWVQAAYARGRNLPASTSGFGAARRILDAAGLTAISIETVPGSLSDHYA